jgi:hypothetical protein
MSRDGSQAYLENVRIDGAAVPEVVTVNKYRDVSGMAIKRAIEGAKVAEMLEQAQKEFQEVFDKTEK